MNSCVLQADSVQSDREVLGAMLNESRRGLVPEATRNSSWALVASLRQNMSHCVCYSPRPWSGHVDNIRTLVTAFRLSGTTYVLIGCTPVESSQASARMNSIYLTQIPTEQPPVLQKAVGHIDLVTAVQCPRGAVPNKVDDVLHMAAESHVFRSLQGKAAVCKASTYHIQPFATLGLTSMSCGMPIYHV